MLCGGLAVLRGCCVVGVLAGALCDSGGWHIVVLARAVVCEWQLAHNGATVCLLLHDPWRHPGQQWGISPDCMPRRCRHELAQ